MDYTITALSDHTGTEVRRIDLARPVDEADRAVEYRLGGERRRGEWID